MKIFTARVACGEYDEPARAAAAKENIQRWLVDTCHLPELEVTCVKDYGMVELWDDRAVQVVPTTGEPVNGK